MNILISRLVPAALLATVPLLLMPLAADAQEVTEEAAHECKATLKPAEIETGQTAVRVDARLTSDIGAVSELEAPDQSGVRIASGEELARVRVEMARPGEEGRAEEPIQMSDDGHSATVWLTTVEAKPGSYDVKLKGEGDRHCTARVTVKPADEGPSY